MKKILTLLLASVTTLAIAQKKVNLSRSTDDDGKSLTIRVTGTIDGREVDYERTFDVEGLSPNERLALRDKILDSIATGHPLTPETTPAAPVPAAQAEEPDDVVAYAPNKLTVNALAAGEANAAVDENPFTKLVKYNTESGELFLRYTFTKDREEFIYEKTVRASGKSESERLEIVRDFEQEIELPGQGI